MKIGKKLFLMLLSLSLASLAMSTAIGLFQLLQTKSDVGEAQNVQAMELTDTNIEVMKAVNADMITTLALNYSENIESKFTAITQQVLTIQSYLQGAYQNGAKTVSRFPDDMVYLQPDVSLSNVEAELHTIKAVRDLIASVMEADPNIAVYYVSESGLLLADRYVDYAAGGDIDRRTRPWYVGAVEKHGVFWTPVYTDALSGKMTITCSAPVIGENGAVLGVIGCDLLVDPLIETVLDFSSDVIEYTFFMDDQGNDFVGSIPNKTLSDFIDDESHRAGLTEDMLQNTSGVGLYEDGIVMAGYAPVPATGWCVGVIVDYQKIIAPSQSMREAINASNNDLHQYLDGKIRNAILISVITALVIFLFVLLVSRRVTHSITMPLALLTNGVSEVSGGNLTHHIELHSKDELEHLASAFNTMTWKLREYIHNLTEVTAERERIASDLRIATDIQADMLPKIFPPFANRDDIHIATMMQPAKEVGGDFYDFFFLDDEQKRIALIVADVSGKGVPAALFMVIAKVLIKNNKDLPADLVLSTVNNLLCTDNNSSMFVTTYYSVLDLETGEYTYASAGHNPPILYREEDKTVLYLTLPKTPPLALFPNKKFSAQTLTLKKGDTILLYTDGVTEAFNTTSEMYGTDRLLYNMSELSRQPVETMVSELYQTIQRFAGDEPQSDDITMLCCRFFGRR